MNEKEYDDKRKKLNLDHDKQLANIDKEYALSNNPYNVGDVISDHYKTIRIKKIRTTRVLLGKPTCLYEGLRLNKDGTISKRQDDCSVFQRNIAKPNED